ncbi:MAG: hypothetical protein H6923_10075 [Alphaproteobacteria bacterium]|nr:hypothetical protein [Alphaproteobacteria bacterium]
MTRAKGTGTGDPLTETLAALAADGFEVRKGAEALRLAGLGRELAPDAVARRGAETIVIGLKRSPADAGRLVHLARAAEEMEGLSFRLVLADVPPPVARPRLERASLTEARMARRRAEALLAEGQGALALILGWAALEAAARARLDGDEAVAAGPLAGEALAKSLVALGLVPDTDYPALSDAAYRAEAIAHGYLGLEAPGELVARVLALVDTILRRRTADPLATRHHG